MPNVEDANGLGNLLIIVRVLMSPNNLLISPNAFQKSPNAKCIRRRLGKIAPNALLMS